MNFIESLSLSSGLKSSTPRIEDSFFPIVSEKYITICTADHQSKQWDHFQEFINILRPIVVEHGIEIIEIGSNQVQFSGVVSLKGATSPNHWSYLVKNSLFHIGPENVISHFASLHNTPQIVLFSNTSPEYSSPNWSSVHPHQSFICANLKGQKPSYLGEENPKTINSITAEEVVSDVLGYFGWSNPFREFSTVSTGFLYHSMLIEVVPDHAPDPSFFPQSLLNVRLDYKFDESFLLPLATNRKVTLVTDKCIDKALLQQLRPAIEVIFFKVNEDTDISYLNELKKMGYPLSLVAKSDCDLSGTRLKFLNWKVEEEMKKEKKDLDNLEKICDTTRYKSSRHLFSNLKKYSSKSAYLKDIESHEDQFIIDDKDFWEESDYFKLYNITRNDKEDARIQD
jgi:hypothetical protein